MLKLPPNIWMIFALYPPIVQIERMCTLNMTRVVSNSWEEWRKFKPSEVNESKTDWHKNHIFGTFESWFLSTNLLGSIQTKCVNAIVGWVLNQPPKFRANEVWWVEARRMCWRVFVTKRLFFYIFQLSYTLIFPSKSNRGKNL